MLSDSAVLAVVNLRCVIHLLGEAMRVGCLTGRDARSTVFMWNWVNLNDIAGEYFS